MLIHATPGVICRRIGGVATCFMISRGLQQRAAAGSGLLVHGFSSADASMHQVVPPGGTAQCAVTYSPVRMTPAGVPDEGTLFLALPGGGALLHALRGAAGPPLAAGALQAQARNADALSCTQTPKPFPCACAAQHSAAGRGHGQVHARPMSRGSTLESNT